MILAILSINIAYSQDQYATTVTGKKILIHSNGTWEYMRDDICSSFDLARYNLAKNKILKKQNFDFYYKTAWQFVNNFGENNYDAIANFEQALKFYPQNSGVYSDLGNCFRGGFKCYNKAEYYYTKAIDNGFSKGFVYYNRAICRYELNKIEEMKSDLEMSRRLGWNNDYYRLSEK